MKSVALMMALLLASGASAGWVSVTGKNETAAVKNLERSDAAETVIRFSIPGYNAETVHNDQKEFSRISIPGTSVLLKKGFPELPKMTSMVALPGLGKVSARIIQSEFTEMETGVIIPSKGNITRDINPDSLPLEFDSVYEKDEWYPSAQNMLKVSGNFIIRDQAGLRVEIIPVQYNPIQGKIRIYTSVTVSLNTEKAVSRISRLPENKDFEWIFENSFINWKRSETRSLQAPEIRKNLLIICHDSFAQAVKPLIDWKKKCGFTVKQVLSSQFENAYAIKTFLSTEFEQGQLGFVLLVGDSQHIPTLKGLYENADSDPCYVKLAGNDNIMDAFISRISCEDVKQCEYIVQKTLHYEQFPAQGSDGSWYKKALAIASDEGNPKDKERMELLNKDLKDKMSFSKITTSYDGGWFSSAKKKHVFDAAKEGVSIINYIGHGSTDSWVTTGFSSSDCNSLENGMKLPVIWSVACVNGNFAGKTCFAEAWLRSGSREKPAGCIGIAAASTNMAWVPPCVWQKHIISREMCEKKQPVANVQHLFGVLACMEEYGIGNADAGNQLSEQTHYFGDGTVSLRFETPVNVKVSQKLVNGNIELSFDKSDDLTVTFYSENMDDTLSVKAGSNVKAVVPAGKYSMFTVTGPDVIPLIDEEIR